MTDADGYALRLYERFLRHFRASGMPEGQAQAAARDASVGRDGAQAQAELREALAAREAQAPDGFDRAVQQFQRLGLSQEAARIAAIGRGRTETEAREAYREAPAQQSGAAQLSESAVPVRITEVVGLVAQRAQQVLHKTPAEAQQFAVNLVERDRRRWGDEYAETSGRAFAAALDAVAASGIKVVRR